MAALAGHNGTGGALELCGDVGLDVAVFSSALLLLERERVAGRPVPAQCCHLRGLRDPLVEANVLL